MISKQILRASHDAEWKHKHHKHSPIQMDYSSPHGQIDKVTTNQFGYWVMEVQNG